MKLAVIGSGYVGLVAGAGFAEFGNEVMCADIDVARVAALGRGEVPFVEPGLPELLSTNVAAGRLRFTTAIATAVQDADVVLICVGTPPAENGAADLGQVLDAARAVAQNLRGGLTVLVLKSTVPVGTAERVFAIMMQSTTPAPPGSAVAVVSNPEFLREGSAVEDFLRPMRIIAGIGPFAYRDGTQLDDASRHALRERIVARLRELYDPVVRSDDRLLVCDARSAELCKYASNAYLAMRVSFINDIANLCERVGADVEMVRRGMGMDERIGKSFLFPGMGYGGSCFPKDVKALLACAQAHDLNLPLIAATEAVNERQRALLFEKLLRNFGINRIAGGAPDGQALANKTIAVWGLSFKPETDDVREAPALYLIERLLAAGAAVRASDPVANRNAGQALSTHAGFERLSFFDDAYEAARDADALFLCTEWRQFRQPNFARLRKLLRGTALFDGRNIWDREQLRALGFHYHGIGR